MLDTQVKLDEEIGKLSREYQKLNKVLVALSGGVDSCLATYFGRKFLGKENAIAIISNSASLKEKDFNIAVNFCEEHDVDYEVIYTKELENSNYTSNPNNRCYFCKNELYETMKSLLDRKYEGFSIINGNNYSDLGDYRPGLSAASEQNAISPFINCKIDKIIIRKLAQHFNLSVWDKPASPCLSSRFPYGEEISEEKLNRVEKAEIILNNFGFNEVRVRSFADLAKIEVPHDRVDDLSKKINKIKTQIKSIGFVECAIDQEGFVSGKMNRVIL